jgi:hypothetical protein
VPASDDELNATRMGRAIRESAEAGGGVIGGGGVTGGGVIGGDRGVGGGATCGGIENEAVDQQRRVGADIEGRLVDEQHLHAAGPGGLDLLVPPSARSRVDLAGRSDTIAFGVSPRVQRFRMRLPI